MNKEHEIEFIKELKSKGVKSKDFNRLIHSFSVIEAAAWDYKISPNEIIAIYKLAEISLARG